MAHVKLKTCFAPAPRLERASRRAESFSPAKPCAWPFADLHGAGILNLQGGPVQTVGVQNSPAFFDVLDDGTKVQTGWGTPGEGYLVYDPQNTPSLRD